MISHCCYSTKQNPKKGRKHKAVNDMEELRP